MFMTKVTFLCLKKNYIFMNLICNYNYDQQSEEEDL